MEPHAVVWSILRDMLKDPDISGVTIYYGDSDLEGRYYPRKEIEEWLCQPSKN